MESRRKRAPVFDENALKDLLEDDWPVQAPAPKRPAGEVPASAPVDPSPPVPVAAQPAPQPASRRPRAGLKPKGARFRPPDAILSGDVYRELTRVSATERRRHGKARSFGVIVLDAIEHHADRLEHAWSVEPAAAPEPGSLFIRPTSAAVPERRSHRQPPRTISLAGIDAANAQLLDEYATKWGAGSRSALVEQALRYEFEL